MTTSSAQIQIISIEGNIGSGKTTLFENLKKRYSQHTNIVFLKEPVDEWCKIKDENGMTMLEKFYQDQSTYSFPFQMMAYISRLKLLKDTIQSNPCSSMIIITERSLYTDKMVFAKMLYDSHKMEYVNYQIYLQWFDTFVQEFPIHKIIYVNTKPEICHARIAVRHRDGEDHIPLEYLKTCHDYHTQMLDTHSTECVCANQLVLDCNQDIYQNINVLDEWLGAIDTFISLNNTSNLH
jgi:deoxyadenosine/deoxycytidine kinase